MKKIYTKNNYIVIEYGNIKLMRPKKNIFFTRSSENNKYYLKDTGQKIPNELELSLWTDYVDSNDQQFDSLELFETFITENTGNFNSGSIVPPFDPQDYDIAAFTNTSADPFVQGSDIKTFNGYSLLGSGNLVRKNEAGQVKVNYTGLSIVGYVKNAYKQFNIRSAVPTISPYPTTKYPNSLPNGYTGVFDSTRNGGSTTFQGRIIENPIPGQYVNYRIRITYSGKNTSFSATQVFFLRLRNPVSGFSLTSPTNITTESATGEFTVVFTTIADTASIASPNGYILEGTFSDDDDNFTTTITDITWFYNAIEP